MKTRVIHMRQAPPGWKSNPQYVYIGRGSPWGNYFRIGNTRNGKVLSRDDVCDLFEKHGLPGLLARIHLLRGKILVCYCKPERCHGDCYIEVLEGCPCKPEVCHGENLISRSIED